MIFASDSQTTCGAAKSLDAQKISVVNFQDAQVLVAQSGSADLADKAIEILAKKAKHIRLENDDTAAQVAKESIREIRNHLKELNQGCVTTDGGWKRLFYEENYFQILIGCYFEQKPFMFTVDIDSCLPIPVKHPYKAIGIGKDYGEILLRDYLQIDPDFEYAQIIASAVVEKAIDNVDGCGRPTWLGIVCPQDESVLLEYRKQQEAFDNMGKTPDKPYFKSSAVLLSQEEIKWVTDELNHQEDKLRQKRKETMLDVLKAAQNHRDQWAKKIRSESA